MSRLAAWWQRVMWPGKPLASERGGAQAGPVPSLVAHDAVVIPPIPERPLGDRVLRPGCPRGADVAWVQARLGVAPADGWYGPDTAAAVAAWQDEQDGMLADGVVGPATWTALGLAGVTAPAVFVPPLAVDAFTPLVERALRALDVREASAWAAVLSAEMQRHQIITTARIAGFLANCSVETGRFTRLVEILHYSAERLVQVWPGRFPTLELARPYAGNGPALAERVYGGRMGNDRPGDGWRFRGRGCAQTTGRANYTTLSRVTGDSLDALTGEPSPLEARAGAVRAAVVFWASISGNTLADAGDGVELRRRWNGGAHGLQEVLAGAAKIRAALG